MQPDLLFFVCLIPMLVLLLLMIIVAKCCTVARRTRNYLCKTLFWTTSLRLMMELYLEIVMFAIVNIIMLKDNNKDLLVTRLSDNMAIAFLLLAI